jgi:hypothetical protein
MDVLVGVADGFDVSALCTVGVAAGACVLVGNNVGGSMVTPGV